MSKQKKALLNSALSLLLCFSMLLGTTFAWFTDSVTSTNNIIQSGNLDVEMYYCDTNSADENDWKDASTGAIFDYQYWEPGFTQTKYVKITNEGSLAFRFVLNIVPNVVPETGKPNLADVIDVYMFAPDATIDRAAIDAATPVGTLADLMADSDGAAHGVLLPAEGKGSATVSEIDAPKGEISYCIVLKMQEDAGNEYQDMSVGEGFSVQLLATQYAYEEDTFGSDYDKDSEWPGVEDVSVSVAVKTENNVVTEAATASVGGVKVSIPVGVAVKEGIDELTLTVTEKENSDSNVTAEANEKLIALDVHIDGVSEGNTTPIIIELGKVLPVGLNVGNLTLYHVEGGNTVAMIQEASVDALDEHDEFYYDPATGEVTVAMATFSELTVLADTTKAWEGNYDYSWYDASKTELSIANADQLAGLGTIVGGMAKDEDGNYIYTATKSDDEEIHYDTFNGKTVKLISDVNLGDADNANETLIFHPIGYYYTDDKNADGTTGDYYSTVSSFEGTFDGNGHTIANFYQNTWEIKGDYDGNYYKDAMGLFGYVVNGTVKNLTVDNFSSDGEFTPTGVIAAYAVNSTFENIAITNCNPRVYNTGNGGIVGIGGNSDDLDTYKLTFTNITIDNSNKISALWGSWDVACGGLVGMFRGAGHVYMTNCHVASQIDVYNDVCGNYQYYWYRYAGMMVGTNRNMVTDEKGYTVPETTKFHAENCTVHFGDWNDYYYCELVANTKASYTHDHQFSRLTQISSLDEIKSGDTWTKTGNFLLIDGDTETCYHIVKDSNGTLKQHLHTDAGYEDSIDEDGDGNVDLKEDKQIVYLPFNQLFTGYGWGVKHIPVYNGEDYAFEGITILDREVGNSVDKFNGIESVNLSAIKVGDTVSINDLFTKIEGTEVAIRDDSVIVSVTDLTKTGITADFTRGATWDAGTLKFNGTNGIVKITIQDYYFCNPTSITVEIGDFNTTDRFAVAFPNADQLNRVGNSGTVALGKLFSAEDGIGENVTVTFETVTGATVDEATITATKSDWTTQTVQFSNTGIMKVTISDDNFSTPVTQYLEVVDAVNATSATNATANNVVLLNDISSGFTVSGRYAVYGNGFTLNYTGNGQYLNNGLKQGVVTVSENGTLDNLRIKASIYPAAYIYYSDQVQKGPSTIDGDKTRYHYQLSAVAASGNATISNCYIYGGRNNIFINTGDVTVKDTVLECAPVANVQIQSNSDHTVTFENVTTIQYRVNATIVDTTAVMMGAGIVVGPETNDNPAIVLNGDFKQYNWITEDDANNVTDTGYTKPVLNAALNATAYNHTVSGKTASNAGIIYMNTYDAPVTNNTGLPYAQGDVTMTISSFDITGRVYSLQGANTDQIYSDYENADRATVNGLYQPQFKYADDFGGQYIENTDDCDEYCYRNDDTVEVMFLSGDTKELDLAALVDIAKYTGQNLGLVVTCKDSNGNAVTVNDGKITLFTAETYTVTYTVTDALFYDMDGNVVVKDPIDYSWDVTLSVSLKDASVSNAYFEFVPDSQKMGYYKPLIGDVKQYLPFLAGLQIYDYNGPTSYLRFDGDSDFNKVASITITEYASNEAYIEVKLTDGGVINTKFLARADSGGGSTYTGSIKTSDSTIYFVNDGGTSSSDATTTAAYWYVDYYKFIGNNGVEITSDQQTFNSTGSSASTPSGIFSTTINYTVTYDANGGNCGQTVGYATSVSSAVTLPTPTRSGYIFAGWYTAASGGDSVGGAGDSYTPSANITLYAQWGEPCTVTYDANGGSCDTDPADYNGTALILPTATRDGYWFSGWYDAAEGGNKIGDAGASYNPTSDITLYAHWQEEIEYTVTYDANGGFCSDASAIYQGTALTLPTPTRTGYTFNGWYTATSGGTKVGDAAASYTPDADITLYAQWKKTPYTITVSTTNATVSGVTNKQTAYYGDTISVTVTFSKNYSKTLTVTDSSGSTVLSESTGGTYTFTMPASNVTISASSSACVTGDTLVTLADGTQKRIDEVTYEDQLLVWNFYTGCYATTTASVIYNHGDGVHSVTNLHFSDGTMVKMIAEHEFFDVEANSFVYISESNVTEHIGHYFVKMDGNDCSTVTLDGFSYTEEETGMYTILTAEHFNAILEGMLSLTPDPTNKCDMYFRRYEVGEDMKFDEAKMQADIEKYGLYTYEDFAEYVTYDEFVAFDGGYLKILVGKGLITFEDILNSLSTYAPNH